MIEPIRLEHQIIAKAIDQRDERLEGLLRELGPGWAIGFRVKQQPYPALKSIGAPQSIDMEWETHEVPVVEGEIIGALAGFHYVTLRPQKELKGV